MSYIKNGTVKVANEIILQLIAESALTVDGVVNVIGYKNKRVEKFNLSGIKVEKNDNKLDITLYINISKGFEIYKIAEKVQDAIKEYIDIMLGLKVKDVQVFIKEII